MRPESAKYLKDMLDAANAIQEHVKEQTLEDYLRLRWMRDAVTWNFCVIGESLSQLMKFDEVLSEQISDARKIVGLRNQLIHGYGVINHEITWRIIEEKLPILTQELQELLDS